MHRLLRQSLEQWLQLYALIKRRLCHQLYLYGPQRPERLRLHPHNFTAASDHVPIIRVGGNTSIDLREAEDASRHVLGDEGSWSARLRVLSVGAGHRQAREENSDTFFAENQLVWLVVANNCLGEQGGQLLTRESFEKGTQVEVRHSVGDHILNPGVALQLVEFAD